jgi:hypothetical protein
MGLWTVTFIVADPVAQLAEHLTFNQRVLGSNPSGVTSLNALKSTLRVGSGRFALRETGMDSTRVSYRREFLRYSGWGMPHSCAARANRNQKTGSTMSSDSGSRVRWNVSMSEVRAGAGVYGIFLENLLSYSKAHFRFEETCMLAAQCSAAQARFESTGFERSAVQTLVEWLESSMVAHIGKIDIQLRGHLPASPG